ncbi:MAG TPA: protein kinase [Gemmataceae bacterium]|nr:protein kinase [Gemmataceae bacterium]
MLQSAPSTKKINTEPIAGYRLLHLLGKGGYAEVWKCEAPGGFVKAIKFVYGNLNGIDDQARLAEQELRAIEWLKVVRHPFILSIERVEIMGGELVIIMELADKNLEDRLVECQSTGLPGIPRSELLAYLRDAAEALDLMNFQHDLQHLDIKPRNLFLIGNRLKVADFGLVQCLEELTLGDTNGDLPNKFTPSYAAPELFKGSISRHSDQYSLAVAYQELLTGTRPFQGANPRRLAMQHLNDKPDLSAIAENERPVLLRALAKDPQDRFPSCLALMRALINVQSDVQSVVLPPNPGDPSLLTPLPPALRMTDTMEDFFLSTVVPRGSKPDVELPNSRMIDLASEVDHLRRQLSDSDAEIRRIEEKAKADRKELLANYEALISNKFDALRKKIGLASSESGKAPPSPEELFAVANDLERQRTQLKREEKELQAQIRAEEVKLCKERAEVSRQQSEWQRLHPKGGTPSIASMPAPAPADNHELEKLRQELNAVREQLKAPREDKEIERLRRDLEEQREQLKADELALRSQIEHVELQSSRERGELAKQRAEYEQRRNELIALKTEYENKQRELQAQLKNIAAAESVLAQKLAPLAHLKDTIEQVLSIHKTGSGGHPSL